MPAVRPKKTSKKSATRYALHPAYRMEGAYKKNLEERTGRTFEEWVALARREGPADRTGLRAWLKKEHGLSTNYAWWVAGGEESSAESYDPDACVAAQYSGNKAALLPLYERLLDLGFEMGDDVRACPCETMVPLYRKFVFAEIKAATATRIDVGLALGDEKASGRLESLGSRAHGNRITHRIAIDAAEGIDGEVRRWLRAAYDRGNDQRARPGADGKESKVPPDLKKALDAAKKAQPTWTALTPRMRADWIGWITQAAKPETRAKRIGQAIEKLAAGKKRMY